MSQVIVNARQRVLITSGEHGGMPLLMIEIRRIGARASRGRYLNIRANYIDEFIALLQNERDYLMGRLPGGDE